MLFCGHPDGVDGRVCFRGVEECTHNGACLQYGEYPANITEGKRLAHVGSIYDESSPGDAVGKGTPCGVGRDGSFGSIIGGIVWWGVAVLPARGKIPNLVIMSGVNM